MREFISSFFSHKFVLTVTRGGLRVFEKAVQYPYLWIFLAGLFGIKLYLFC